VVETGAPTTLAVARTDASGAAEYSFYLEGTSAPAYDPDGLDLGGCSMLVTGGLALAVAPLAERVGALLDRLPPVVAGLIDLNCRPAVVGDRAAYTARVRALGARATVVKASEEDLAYLAPGDSAERTAEALVEGGCGAVLITRGADPTTVLGAAGSVQVPVPAPAGPVVDTIGAGDTFCGAVAARLAAAVPTRRELATASGLEALVAAVEIAHRAAAIVVTRRGADPPWAGELDAPAPDQSSSPDRTSPPDQTR
jgi:fructokinase